MRFIRSFLACKRLKKQLNGINRVFRIILDLNYLTLNIKEMNIVMKFIDSKIVFINRLLQKTTIVRC